MLTYFYSFVHGYPCFNNFFFGLYNVKNNYVIFYMVIKLYLHLLIL